MTQIEKNVAEEIMMLKGLIADTTEQISRVISNMEEDDSFYTAEDVALLRVELASYKDALAAYN